MHTVTGYLSKKDGAILPTRDYPRCSVTKNFPESQIINPLLIKLFHSRWLDTGFVLFFASLWTLTLSHSIKTQKGTWPISSHLDRKSLVNNPYILPKNITMSLARLKPRSAQSQGKHTNHKATTPPEDWVAEYLSSSSLIMF